MQKFRFLLPLLILTLLVVVISFSIRSYSPKNNISQSTQSAQGNQTNTGSTESLNGENAPPSEVSPQKPSLLSRIFGGTKETTNTQNQSTVTKTPTPTKANASFSQQEVAIPINEERTVEIMVDAETEVPNAYTFHIQFDPNAVSVSRIEPGDIWKQVVVFTKDNKIDNANGTVRYSAAQSLGSAKANGKVLLRVFIKAKATAASGSELTILNPSQFAYVGLDHEVLLESKSIQVQVTK